MAGSRWIGLSALELARHIRQGEVTSHEVVSAHLSRIAETQKDLNAVVAPRAEQALKEAHERDRAREQGAALGPLHGVPISIKESFDILGLPTTGGLCSRKGHIAAKTSPFVEKLVRAGAVVVGKSNVSQLLFYLESDNPVYGRCNNPYHPERTPGGSSGGEAALIAAGGSALGLGSDIGGSVRIPAHFCGLSGFKPTSGRLNPIGTMEDIIMPGQEAILSQAGPLARRVEDLDTTMSILLDDGALGPKWQPRPLGDVRGVRVGVFEHNGVIAASPALRRAVREAAEILRERGAEVVPFEPAEPWLAAGLYTTLMTADGGQSLRRALAGSKTDKRLRQMLFFLRVPRPFRLAMRALALATGQKIGERNLREAGPVSTGEYFRLVAERNAYKSRFLQSMDDRGVDVLLCPPLATVALRHGTAVDLTIGQSYCSLFNLLGMPAGTVAATRVRPGEESDRPPSVDYVIRRMRKLEEGSAGLPLGVQIAGRPSQDEQVMSVMAAVESGFLNRPDYPSRPVVFDA